ncbi:unnamed protein product [Bursaphelenchus xylophilus]|uniref:ADP-ribosylation factor-related protein 1 n=1 Tax=Bursaphelenchus xylophilus TaxID=6326 RepID=A0A1I7S0S6_BURXY|nr:unnamed protein product [Bursaphelenchus xylophilus]CAG9088363.1 unnamed protein product [Bursaphelenchus xylophilus]
MFSLGRGMYQEMVRKDEFFVLVCGAEGVGKTTFAEQIRAQCDPRFKAPKKPSSTIGLNLVKFETDGFLLNFWDVGGNVELQDLWNRYLDDCHAIIFVAETTGDEEKIEESLQAFERVQKHERALTLPLLILMNKSDQLEEEKNGENHKIEEGKDVQEAQGPSRLEPKISRDDLFKFIERQENTPIGMDESSSQTSSIRSSPSLQDQWKKRKKNEVEESPRPGSLVRGWTETDDERYDQFKAYGWSSCEMEEEHASNGDKRRLDLMEELRERADKSHRADLAVFSISALKAHNLERCR